MRRRCTITLLLVVVACSRGTAVERYIASRLAATQDAPLCFSGTANLFADSLAPSPQPYERRWLVLDTASVAYVVTPERHQLPIFAEWRQVGDSLEVHETNGMAPANWVLARHADTLVGRGFMIHDVVETDSAGNIVPRRSDWKARAVRTPCALVP